MDALLNRIFLLSKCTIGEFFFDGHFICYMLEDMERADGVKIANVTCIPHGLKYFIGRALSPKFKKVVPVIYTHRIGSGTSPGDYEIRDAFGNVWKAVEIHPGNDDTNTDACQLPGLQKDVAAQRVLNSVKACEKLYPLIFDALDRGETINYTIQHIAA